VPEKQRIAEAWQHFSQQIWLSVKEYTKTKSKPEPTEQPAYQPKSAHNEQDAQREGAPQH